MSNKSEKEAGKSLFGRIAGRIRGFTTKPKETVTSNTTAPRELTESQKLIQDMDAIAKESGINGNTLLRIAKIEQQRTKENPEQFFRAATTRFLTTFIKEHKDFMTQKDFQSFLNSPKDFIMSYKADRFPPELLEVIRMERQGFKESSTAKSQFSKWKDWKLAHTKTASFKLFSTPILSGSAVTAATQKTSNAIQKTFLKVLNDGWNESATSDNVQKFDMIKAYKAYIINSTSTDEIMESHGTLTNFEKSINTEINNDKIITMATDIADKNGHILPDQEVFDHYNSLVNELNAALDQSPKVVNEVELPDGDFSEDIESSTSDSTTPREELTIGSHRANRSSTSKIADTLNNKPLPLSPVDKRIEELIKEFSAIQKENPRVIEFFADHYNTDLQSVNGVSQAFGLDMNDKQDKLVAKGLHEKISSRLIESASTNTRSGSELRASTSESNQNIKIGSHRKNESESNKEIESGKNDGFKPG